MNTQQAYERMRAWLTRPGATQALDDHGNCQYLAPDLNRCAIGGILSHEALVEMHAHEGSAIALIDTNPKECPITKAELAGVNLDFLACAQTLHDGNDNWTTGRFDVAQLDALAGRYRLTVVTDEPVVVPDYPPAVEAEPALVGA